MAHYKKDKELEWDDKELSTTVDVHNAVMEIVRLYREYGSIGLLPTEFLDNYGSWLEAQGDNDGWGTARNNIGYMAGNEDRETKHLIFELFECEHPVMGKSDPTPEEAFELGKKWGEAMKEGRPFP